MQLRKLALIIFLACALGLTLFGVVYGIVTNTHPDGGISPRALESLPHRVSSDTLCPFNKDSHLINSSECEERGCIWDPEKAAPLLSKGPSCFNPGTPLFRYTVETIEEFPNGDTKLLLKLANGSKHSFPPDVKETLLVHFTHYGNYTIRIKITVPNETRYEVPIQLNYTKSELPFVSQNFKLNFSFIEPSTKDDFAIRIWRKETGALIFDSTIGGFAYADQFLQISTRLPSENLFGLGENSHYTFRHDLNYKTWPMFARDQGPEPGEHNLYGSHPVYYVIENDGNSHGVFWLNSNAMEAETLPAPGLTLRSIGGIMDLFIFAGPSPSEVISQYTSLVGKPYLPPYWALGFQLCRSK